MILSSSASPGNDETEPASIINPTHAHYLLARAVPLRAAVEAGLRSVDACEASELLAYPVACSGLLIPYAGIQPPYYRIRLDREDSPRFLTPRGREVPVYFPPSLDPKPDEPIVVAEGPIKALALVAHGFAAVGLGGTGTTLTAAPERNLNGSWQRVHLKGRRVVILFDSNRATNLRVARDEARLAMALKRAGAEVQIGRIPS